LAVRAKKEVESALLKKGFRKADGDHHWFVYWSLDGRKTTVRTKTSHGSTKDLGDGLLKEMARQTRIQKAEFLNLVDCPMSQQQYDKILNDAGHV
jgi:predicted RNA binding protein YcfA (HicA-like mRNA interferase family)